MAELKINLTDCDIATKQKIRKTMEGTKINEESPQTCWERIEGVFGRGAFAELSGITFEESIQEKYDLNQFAENYEKELYRIKYDISEVSEVIG